MEVFSVRFWACISIILLCVHGHHFTFGNSMISNGTVLSDSAPSHIMPCDCIQKDLEEVLVQKEILREYAHEACP